MIQILLIFSVIISRTQCEFGTAPRQLRGSLMASSKSKFPDLPHYLTNNWTETAADFPFLSGNSVARSPDLPYNEDGKPVNHNASGVVQGLGPPNVTIIVVHTDNFTR